VTKVVVHACGDANSWKRRRRTRLYICGCKSGMWAPFQFNQGRAGAKSKGLEDITWDIGIALQLCDSLSKESPQQRN